MTEQSDLNKLDLAKRLELLNGELAEIARLRGRLRWISLLGVLLLVGLLGVFAYRVVSYAGSIREPERQQEYLAAISKEIDTEALIAEQQEWVRREIVTNRAPAFVEKVRDRFEERLPEIGEALGGMQDRIVAQSQAQVEQRLTDAILSNLERNEKELSATFSHYDERKIQAEIERAKTIYAEAIHDVIEEKYAMLDPSIAAFQGRARGLAEAERLDEASAEQLAQDITDTLVDLVVYELKPELGDLPATYVWPTAESLQQVGGGK